MRKIYKYKLEIEGDTFVRMPVGSKILSVGFQNNDPYVWALINLRAHECARRIRVVPTGEEVDLTTWSAPLVGMIQRKSMVEPTYWVAHVFDMGENNL